MLVQVECDAGHHGEETPRRVGFDGRSVELVEVLDCWLGLDHRYFKMLGAEGATYTLRHDSASGRWEMRMYEVPRAQENAWTHWPDSSGVSPGCSRLSR